MWDLCVNEWMNEWECIPIDTDVCESTGKELPKYNAYNLKCMHMFNDSLYDWHIYDRYVLTLLSALI